MMFWNKFGEFSVTTLQSVQIGGGSFAALE